MPNYKISIQYDGSDFFGWQSQPNGNTIQDELVKAISQITGENVNLIGSGRTDSGVHALGQVANFRIPKSIDEFKFNNSLNSILPSAISIKTIEQVTDNFHSRFDAKKRIYNEALPALFQSKFRPSTIGMSRVFKWSGSVSSKYNCSLSLPDSEL